MKISTESCHTLTTSNAHYIGIKWNSCQLLSHVVCYAFWTLATGDSSLKRCWGLAHEGVKEITQLYAWFAAENCIRCWKQRVPFCVQQQRQAFHAVIKGYCCEHAASVVLQTLRVSARPNGIKWVHLVHMHCNACSLVQSIKFALSADIILRRCCSFLWCTVPSHLLNVSDSKPTSRGLSDIQAFFLFCGFWSWVNLLMHWPIC